jgi:hypothetical protein
MIKRSRKRNIRARQFVNRFEVSKKLMKNILCSYFIKINKKDDFLKLKIKCSVIVRGQIKFDSACQQPNYLQKSNYSELFSVFCNG